MRCFCLIYVIFLAFAVVGCGSVAKSIMAEQEWSENYAVAEGVQATSPLMVDGNRRTTGETELPTDIEGDTQFTEAVIKLPEEETIRRIVIYTTNMENFVVYAAADGGQLWKPLHEVKNNQEEMVELRVVADTDQIKVRVRKTSDDERLTGRGNRWRSVRRAKGKIQEIEIYGLVGKEIEQETEQVVDEIEGTAVPATFVAADTPEAAESQAAAAPDASSQETPAGEKPEVAKQDTKPGAPAPKTQPKPQSPPAAVSLESPQDTYSLAVPIPMMVNVKIGPDDLVVLADQVKDEMLFTKILVKNATGETIACSVPAPKLSSTKPYRSSGRPVDVRDAATLDADSNVMVDIPNLLEYYPITEPGTYTVQFSMRLAVHSKFVGRYQTQMQDLEASIRDINTSPGLAQSDKRSVTQGMREELNELKLKKEHRYIISGTRGKSLQLNSNILELVIQ
ncbi:hypothetical protein ACFL6S_26970 [Candidatus Poribacteria bacterium]